MIKGIWDKVKVIYRNKQGTLFSSTLAVALTLLLARILGVIKLSVLTSYYTKEQLDLFLAAFRLPDFIFEILVAGSIASCFIPIISDLARQDKSKIKIVSFSASVSIWFLFFWGIVFIITLPFFSEIIQVLVPGYTGKEVLLISEMSKSILFFQVPFLLLGNILSALLQNEKSFFIPGLAPVVYNAGIILGVLWWADNFGLQAALYGVILGAVMYFLILLPALLALEYPFFIHISLFSGQIKKFFKLFFPRMLSSVIAQIDASVDLALSTLRGLGSYTSFYLARNLQILPVSFLGIAISQTALPFFSDLYNQGKKKDLLEVFLKLVMQIFFIVLPIVVFFTILRVPIVRLLFGREKFDWIATVQTANILSWFAISLPFHTAYYLITRAFFAIQDTRTPLIVSIIFTIFNTVLSFIFIKYLNLPVWFLALSFSISMILNSSVLFYILIKKLNHLRLGFLVVKFGSIFFVTGITAAWVFLLKRFLDGLIFDTARTIQLFFLTATCVSSGLFLYLYLAWIFLPQELGDLVKLFKRLNVFKKVVPKDKKIFYPAHESTEDTGPRVY